MLKLIADLLDFDQNVFSDYQILEDFSHKFDGSWVIIDDGFYKVLSLYQDDDATYKLKVSNIEGDYQYLNLKYIRTIKPYLPPTGLYQSPHGLIYLSRIPARQWLKSYAEDKNYKCTILAEEQGIPNTRNTILEPATQYHPETIISPTGDVWIHWLKVGKLNKRTNNIHLKDTTFIKEITELWPQYQTILDVEPQPAQQAERLITDF